MIRHATFAVPAEMVMYCNELGITKEKIIAIYFDSALKNTVLVYERN